MPIVHSKSMQVNKRYKINMRMLVNNKIKEKMLEEEK